MGNDNKLSLPVAKARRCALAGTLGEEAFGLEQSGGGWGGQTWRVYSNRSTRGKYQVCNSIELSTVSLWKWPYGQQRFEQEPTCKEV